MPITLANYMTRKAIQWAQIDLGVDLSTISIYFFKSIHIDLMMKVFFGLVLVINLHDQDHIWWILFENKFFGDVLRDWLFTKDRWLMMTISILDECLDFFCDGSQWSRSDLMKFLKFSSETFLEKGDYSKNVHKISKNICLKMAWLDKDMKGFEIGVDDLRKELNSKLR